MADLAFAKVITCYEALGQMALLLCLARRCPGSRLSVRMSTWCDNTGAESASDKLYSSFVVQRPATFNLHGDTLGCFARWPGDTERISLRHLWARSPPILVVPADYRLKWDLPERFLSEPSKAAS